MIIGTLFANVTIQVLTFVTAAMIARALGPVGRGELAIVLLYPQLIVGIALMGTDRAVAALGGRGDLSRPVRAMAVLALMLSIPTAAVAFAVVKARIADEHLVALATAYLMYVPAVLFFVLAVALFNGLGDSARFNRTRLCFYVLNLTAVLAVVVLWPAGGTILDGIVFANLASQYGGLAMALWMLRGIKPIERSNPAQVQGLRAVFALALIFAIPAVLAQLGASGHQVATEYLLGAESLGFLVVAYSYTRLIGPIGGAVAAHAFRAGIAGGAEDISRVFRLSLFGCLGVAVPLWLLSGLLIPLIFGREFIIDSVLVGLLFASTLLALSADSLAEYLKGQRKVSADSFARAGYLLILGAVAAFAVPKAGLLGVALGMAVGDLLRCGYLVHHASRATGAPLAQFWRLQGADVSFLLRAGTRALQGQR